MKVKRMSSAMLTRLQRLLNVRKWSHSDALFAISFLNLKLHNCVSMTRTFSLSSHITSNLDENDHDFTISMALRSITKNQSPIGSSLNWASSMSTFHDFG